MRRWKKEENDVVEDEGESAEVEGLNKKFVCFCFRLAAEKQNLMLLC